jgi:hypothetical protein
MCHSYDNLSSNYDATCNSRWRRSPAQVSGAGASLNSPLQSKEAVFYHADLARSRESRTEVSMLSSDMDQSSNSNRRREGQLELSSVSTPTSSFKPSPIEAAEVFRPGMILHSEGFYDH